MSWARLPVDATANRWAYRLSVVRGFASYLHTLDLIHEVPAADLLPWKPHPAVRCLCSDAEIAALMAAASSLGSEIRRATLATLIGLLAVTGLRVSEAIALNRADVELTTGQLLVRHGKFDKAREATLRLTTIKALRAYQRLRDRLFPDAVTPAWFVSNVGIRLLYCNLHNTFHRLVIRAGLALRSALLEVRETRRVVGDYILTENDVKTEARFDDAVGLTNAPIDIHEPGGDEDFEEIDEGVWASAALIKDRGRGIAALSVPCPHFRVIAALQREVRVQVRATADRISQALTGELDGDGGWLRPAIGSGYSSAKQVRIAF